MKRISLVGVAAIAVLAGGLTAAHAAAEPAAAPARDRDLVASVLDELRERTGSPGLAETSAVVNAARQSGDWAFGTAVIPARSGADEYPQGWLFAARHDRAGWTVALEGDKAFAELTATSPLTTDAERPLLAAQDGAQDVTPLAGSDFRTGMALPYSVGSSWSMWGGPHGWSGTPTPWSSLDLSGGDQRVRAARAGTAYTMCTGWLRVIHDRGYATDYYHLWNNINVNGAAVSQGTYLGDTGTDVTCGGSANGRHVHFGLRQNNAYVGVAGHNIGGWVPVNGGSAYGGYALHGSTVANVGGSLHNYGALGFTQGIIDSNGGGAVNKRSGPGTGYGIVGSVADGATVTVSCSANGTTHSGRYGATSLWNRLTDGTWVTDAFMWTGVNGPVNGYC